MKSSTMNRHFAHLVSSYFASNCTFIAIISQAVIDNVLVGKNQYLPQSSCRKTFTKPCFVTYLSWPCGPGARRKFSRRAKDLKIAVFASILLSCPMHWCGPHP